MGNVDLGGFDVVVHLAEQTINQGLELVPSGSTFPLRERRQITLTALGVPAPGIGNPTRNVPLLYDAFLEIDRPQITLQQSNGRVTVRCNLSPASQLTFLRAVNAADVPLLTGIIPQIPLAGSVSLDCPFGVEDVAVSLGGQIAAGKSAVARAGGVNATIAVVLPTADATGNVLLASSPITLANITVSTADIRTALGAFAGVIGSRLGDLPLTNPVRLNVGDLPPEIARDVAARISPPGTPAAISLGVLSGVEPRSPGGVIPSPAAGLGVLGAFVGVSNYWIVHLVASLLRRAHPGMTFSFEQNPPSAHFAGAVVVPGGEEPITIRSLDIKVHPDGGLAIHGDATADGGCWTAKIPFDFIFTFTCNPETGSVIPAIPEDSISAVPDVDKDWVCIIVGTIIGAAVGAVIGFFLSGGNPIAAGIGALVGGFAGFVVADKFIIDPLALDGVNLDSISVLGGLTLPLPIASGGLFVETCNVDDLELRARVVYVDLAERHRTGSAAFPPGAGFDLDAGATRNDLDGVSDDRADLYWNGRSLQTLPGATIGPTFDWRSTAFETLSLTDLERFTYSAANTVSLEALVRRSRLGAKVTFAVRTDEGRYAKCRARRDLTGRCSLEYVVYARPAACLSTMVTLDTLSRTVIESGTEICTEVREEAPYQPPVVDVRPADLPAEASTAIFLVAGDQQPQSPEVQALGALVDRFHVDFGTLVLDPGRPPRKPPKPPCGTHQTVDRHVVEWQIVDREQQAVVHILPVGLIAPLTYEWTVFGEPLTGSGTETVGSVTVTHDENSPILTLVAEEGVDLSGVISVRVTDADGRKVRVARSMSSPSRTRTGGCCPNPSAKLTFEGARRQLEQLRVAERVYDAGMARLRRIAAVGRVREVETVTFAEAAARLGRVKLVAGKGRKTARQRR